MSEWTAEEVLERLCSIPCYDLVAPLIESLRAELKRKDERINELDREMEALPEDFSVKEVVEALGKARQQIHDYDEQLGSYTQRRSI